MIVKQPIGPVKIDGTLNRLSIGSPVPLKVLKHWEETKQLAELIESGAIEDSEKEKKSKGNKK